MSNPHEIKTVRCAHCGTIRQQSNHWFVVLEQGGQFRCSLYIAEAGNGGRSWTSRRGLRNREKPVCGQQCAQKLFERYLAGEGAGRAHGARTKMPGWNGDHEP